MSFSLFCMQYTFSFRIKVECQGNDQLNILLLIIRTWNHNFIPDFNIWTKHRTCNCPVRVQLSKTVYYYCYKFVNTSPHWATVVVELCSWDVSIMLCCTLASMYGGDHSGVHSAEQSAPLDPESGGNSFYVQQLFTSDVAKCPYVSLLTKLTDVSA